MKKLFYDIKNKADALSLDIMVYGQIISGSDKWDESDVVARDFIKAIAEMGDKKTINLYINSPGGSIFTTSGIIAILGRAQAKGVIVNAYIDGLAASAASFLAMAADNLFIYDTSILMIHRAMSGVWGNADDLQATIDILTKLEDSVIIPMYERKAKIETDWLALMKAETWMDANQITDLFNATRIENAKKAVACLDPEVMNRYKNLPDAIKNELKEHVEPPQNPDPDPDSDPEPPKIDNTKAKKELVAQLLKLELH